MTKIRVISVGIVAVVLVERLIGLVSIISFIAGCLTTLLAFVGVALVYFSNERERINAEANPSVLDDDQREESTATTIQETITTALVNDQTIRLLAQQEFQPIYHECLCHDNRCSEFKISFESKNERLANLLKNISRLNTSL
jgi:hypothetical protein